MESGVGKTAKLELLRRIIPLALCVLGIVGGYFFMSVLSSLLCVVAAGGVYAALPRPSVPSGAVKPVSRPPVITLDAIGFGLGVVFFSVAFIGMTDWGGLAALLALFCLGPAYFFPGSLHGLRPPGTLLGALFLERIRIHPIRPAGARDV